MTDTRYQYEKINSIKAIIENKEGKVLLIQEPKTDDWMPLHWGLPGGRPLKKESLYNAFKRTLKEEVGLEIEPLGIYRIEELLHEGRTVFMFIVVAHMHFEAEIKGRVKSHRWVTLQDVEKMGTHEFTAFYAKKLLLDYLSGNRECVDFDLIETQQYYGMHENPEYKRWWESGKKSSKLKVRPVAQSYGGVRQNAK